MRIPIVKKCDMCMKLMCKHF